MAQARRKLRQTTVTRRRGAELEEAILQAAAEVLEESGVPALTMDEVARRAGTNKNALYRRWPNRVALGAAAYRRLAAPETAPRIPARCAATPWRCCGARTAPGHRPTGRSCAV